MATPQVVFIHGITSRLSSLPYEPLAEGLKERIQRVEFHFADWRDFGAARIRVGDQLKGNPFQPPFEEVLQRIRPRTLSERAAVWLALFERDVVPAHPSWTPVTSALRAELALLRWLLDYVADVELYLMDEEARNDIQGYVASILEAAQERGPLVVIAHSLGSVIAFEVLHQRFDARPASLFVTLGSPLQLLLYMFQGMGWVTYELLLPAQTDWINFYDIKDLVASRLVSGDFAQGADYYVRSVLGLRETDLAVDLSGTRTIRFGELMLRTPRPVRANVALNRSPSALLSHNAYWEHNLSYVAVVEVLAPFLRRLAQS